MAAPFQVVAYVWVPTADRPASSGYEGRPIDNAAARGIRRRLQSAVFELIVERHGYRQRRKPTRTTPTLRTGELTHSATTTTLHTTADER